MLRRDFDAVLSHSTSVANQGRISRGKKGQAYPDLHSTDVRMRTVRSVVERLLNSLTMIR